MAESLYFIHDDPGVVEDVTETLTNRGWEVELLPSSAPDAVDRVIRSGCTAMVLFMNGTPVGSCRSLAARVLAEENVVHPLMVFVDAERELVAQMRQDFPAALFVNFEELPWVVKHLSYNG